MNNDLPQSVMEIVEIIGREQALRLIGSLPQSGSRKWRVCLYVPKALQSLDHPLVKVLGWADAKKLVSHFSGEILQPSNCKFLARRVRNRRMFEMREAGHGFSEIARAFDMSPRQVREILKGEPPEAEDRFAS